MKRVKDPKCCLKCGSKEGKHIKKHCFNCWRKYVWKRKKVSCKNCGELKHHHAKGMCENCHKKVYHYDIIKRYNTRKYHNLSLEEYRRLVKSCVACGFDKVVDLHHLDHDRKNNSKTNLISLCPNHHRMLHNYKYSKEVAKLLSAKGYNSKITQL